MTEEEFMALSASEAADLLNGLLAEGKSKDEALAAAGASASMIQKKQVFFVKDKFMARGWGGYTSTQRTGNEGGELGLGGSFKDIKPKDQL